MSILNQKLLLKICENEKLDKKLMFEKYLPEDIKNHKSIESNSNMSQNSDEEILEMIHFEGENYYYQTTGKFIVYNSSTEPVGYFKNGKIIFSKVD